MQVYGAGGKTLPKRGRLGTGSYYPGGTPILLRKGNAFAGIDVVKTDFPEIPFGSPSRAGIATVVGQNRVQTQSLHPNKSQYDWNTQPLCPAMVVSSSNEPNNLQPVAPSRAQLVMPHERNTNSASGTKKKPNVFRTAFGASKSMPIDSAFQKNPSANYKHTKRQKPHSAVEAVKRNVPERSFARVHKPLPVSGGLKSRPNRTPPPSFLSVNNNWSDSNNSFLGGRTTIAGQGTGRWQTVKRGVV